MPPTELICTLISLAPEQGEEAKFYCYSYLWTHVWGGSADDIYDCTAIINDDISPDVRIELFLTHNIAVQLDAYCNGVHGIRILRVD